MRDVPGQPSGLGAAFDKEYAALPEALKMIYTPKEYGWLDPVDRARLLDDLCMPEATED